MRQLLILLLLLPFAGLAQLQPVPFKDSAVRSVWQPEAYVDAGLVSEFWVVAHHLPAGYTTRSYRGPGSYIGLGFKSRTSLEHTLGYGIHLNLVTYNMGNSLNEIEQARTNYSFAQVSPAIYLNLKIKSIFYFNFAGVFSYLQPLQTNERSYVQVGAKGSIGYKFIEANLAFNYSPTTKSPTRDIVTTGWHEQMFAMGVTFYPFRLAQVREYRTKKLINWAKP